LALVGPVFLDTTVLLGGIIELEPGGGDAHRVLDALAADELPGARTAWHCCLEFFSVATRLPEEFRLEPDDARRLLETEILARLEVHDLPADRRRDLFLLAAAERVVGGRIYDRHIASVALAAGARIVVTENVKHFGHLSRDGLRVLRAAEFLAELD
jgi:predicted nucleic acid-binding protein